MLRFPPLLALVLLAAPVAAQVHRCPDAQGRVLLQQAPCAGGERLFIEAQPVISTDADGRPAPAGAIDTAELDRRAAVRRGLEGRYPVVSMTGDELWRAMGAPDTSTVRRTRGGVTEQRSYRRGDRTHRVTLTDGIVTAVSGRTAAQSSRPCPSALAIRNAAVAANSITLDARERARRERELEAMRACR